MSIYNSSAINSTLGIEVLSENEAELRRLFEIFMKDAQKSFLDKDDFGVF
jgi:hypothetical protein